MSSKLRFRYATMGSGKSLEIIQIDYNYKTCEDKNGVLMVPSTDTRGNGRIWTRLGLSAPAVIFSPEENLFEIIKTINRETPLNYVIIDEGNFLKRNQVDQLGDVVDYLDIDVMVYGLMSDFKTNLFEGSKRLLELADVIEEISVRTICWCGRKALHHSRIVNGTFAEEGESIVVDDDDEIKYVPLCRKHFKEKKWRRDI